MVDRGVTIYWWFPSSKYNGSSFDRLLWIVSKWVCCCIRDLLLIRVVGKWKHDWQANIKIYLKEVYSKSNWPGYPKSYSFFMMVLMILQIPLQQSVVMWIVGLRVFTDMSFSIYELIFTSISSFWHPDLFLYLCSTFVGTKIVLNGISSSWRPPYCSSEDFACFHM
jgi:hypothetical protein